MAMLKKPEGNHPNDDSMWFTHPEVAIYSTYIYTVAKISSSPL